VAAKFAVRPELVSEAALAARQAQQEGPSERARDEFGSHGRNRLHDDHRWNNPCDVKQDERPGRSAIVDLPYRRLKIRATICPWLAIQRSSGSTIQRVVAERRHFPTIAPNSSSSKARSDSVRTLPAAAKSVRHRSAFFSSS